MNAWIRTSLCVGAVLAWGLVAGPAWAANEGQSDLDKATEAKIAAETLDDLQKVIDLGESALKKGLDEQNTKFAKSLLSSTYFQRAEKFASVIFDRQPLTPQWPQIRAVAVRDLQRAIAFDEKHGEAHYLHAKLLMLPGGDNEKAAESAAKAVECLQEDKPNLAKALVLRGALGSDNDKRLADFNQALEIDAENLEGLRARGLLYTEMKQPEKAMADFRKVLEQKDDDGTARVGLAEALLDLKKYDEALEEANRVVKQQPRSASGHLLKARIHLSQDDMKAALADTDGALKVEPEDLGALLLRSRLRHSLDDKKGAKEDLDKVFELRPGLPQAILTRSLFAASEKKYDEAIGDVQQLLKDDPGNPDFLLQLATYYVAAKQPRKAISTLNSIIAVQPDNMDAHRSRGDAYLAVGDHKSALVDYEAIVKAEPDNSGALNNLAWTLATSEVDELRDGKRAVELATKACELTKFKAAHILSTLAAAYAETGDFENAIKWSQKAVDEGDKEVQEQLEKELQSYKDKKPWRETQQTEEKPDKKPPVELDL